jgi:hypothetical protein
LNILTKKIEPIVWQKVKTEKPKQQRYKKTRKQIKGI